jgi:hypothetical protein
MKPRDLTDLALRNLREAILRNALTTLGVAVGVASLVAMLSLGVGLQQLAAKRLSQSGLFDTILVTPKNAFRMGRPQREPDSGKPPRVLDDDARKEMEKLPNVIEVYPQVRFFTEVRFNNKPLATVVAGMPDSARNSGSFDGMQGTFFSSTTANEALLRSSVRNSSYATPNANLFHPPQQTPIRLRIPKMHRAAASPSFPKSSASKLSASSKPNPRPAMEATATRASSCLS